MLSEDEKQKLYLKAKEAAKTSYSPYSKFAVGVALLTESDRVVLGTNVENASYGLTICAERAAIVSAISAGERKFRAIAIFGAHGNVTPCGACRQFVLEFGGDIEIICNVNGKLTSFMSAGLMPMAFTEKDF